MAPGCPERLDVDFLKYVWSYPGEHLPRVLRKVEEQGKSDALVRLRSRRQTREWLGGVPQGWGPLIYDDRLRMTRHVATVLPKEEAEAGLGGASVRLGTRSSERWTSCT